MKEYLATVESVLEEQSVNADQGLTGSEATQRLANVGPNKLDEEEKTPLWKRFFEQMADPMVIMLIVAAAISAITGTIQGEPEWADVIIIRFASGEKLVVRPSGTEPKIKYYLFLTEGPDGRKALEEKVGAVKAEFMAAL